MPGELPGDPRSSGGVRLEGRDSAGRVGIRIDPERIQT